MLETGSQICFQGPSHPVPEFGTAAEASKSVIQHELGLPDLEVVMHLVHFYLSESFAVVLCSKTPILWCYLHAIQQLREEVLLNIGFNFCCFIFPITTVQSGAQKQTYNKHSNNQPSKLQKEQE